MASVKWSELYRWALVEVEFGVPKKDITDDLDCVDINSNHRLAIYLVYLAHMQEMKQKKIVTLIYL